MIKRHWIYLTAFAILMATALAVMPVGAAVPERYITVVVQPGDTLWQIGKELNPTQDPRDVVERIRELNGVGNIIHPGQILQVPAE